jgi:REP element-mobilizing transposase RayT
MPKKRYLAPWQQADVMAAATAARLAGADGLSPEDLEALRGKPAIYHCISRVVDRRLVLETPEKERFVAYMRTYEQFCQVRVLAFCVMSNHFHILLEVPAAPPGRGADWSDDALLDHLRCLYPEDKLAEIRWQLGHFRAQENHAAATALRERYFRRMWDLSEFMKTLKQRFTRWFNRVHERVGTLWEARFKSVLVEDGHAARTMAAYIDLNPVRARIVESPEEYRWSSYGEAVAGRHRAREGLQRVMFELARSLGSEERAAGMLLNWRQAAHRYRQVLFAAQHRHEPGIDPAQAPQLTEAQALRCRVRYFADGLAIGSQRFINQVFGLTRSRFGPKRKSGARKLRRIDTELRSLRDLRRDPVVR